MSSLCLLRGGRFHEDRVELRRRLLLIWLVPNRVACLFLRSAVLDAFTSSHCTFRTFGSNMGGKVEMVSRPALGNRYPEQRFRTWACVTLQRSFPAAEWRQTLRDQNQVVTNDVQEG